MSAKIDGKATNANKEKLQGVNPNFETLDVKSKGPQTLGVYFAIYPKYFLKVMLLILKFRHVNISFNILILDMPTMQTVYHLKSFLLVN